MVRKKHEESEYEEGRKEIDSWILVCCKLV